MDSEFYLVFDYYRDDPIYLNLTDAKKADNKHLKKLIKFINNLKTVSLINIKDFIDIEHDYYITNNGLKACTVKEVITERVVFDVEEEKEIDTETNKETKPQTKPKKKSSKGSH